MKRGRTDTETCELNGWHVETRLSGDEGYGPTIIRITAIGHEKILAVTETHDGKPTSRSEMAWTLNHREWQKVGTA